MNTALDRRTFLKHAGIGTAVLAGAPLLGVGATPAMADDHGEGGTGFFFSAVSGAGSPSQQLIMQGCGRFDEVPGRSSGNGFFTYFDGSVAGTPKKVNASGFWEAQRVVSFHSIGSFGVQLAGIMVAEVTFLKQIPQPQVIHDLTLTVVCNLAPAGLFNPGEEEGFQIEVFGQSFKPLSPTNGISGFDRSLAEMH